MLHKIVCVCDAMILDADESVCVCSAMILDAGIFRRNREASAARRQHLQMPVLIALGDHDIALSPNLLTRVGDVIPNADVRIIPRCSHWVQQDCPDLVNSLLSTFLSRDA